MGNFNRNTTDIPNKRPFFKFFEIYFRKFWNFGKANLLYSATLIPTFIIILFLTFFGANILMGSEITFVNGVFVALTGTNLYIALFGMGPATAGMTYIMRNYAREEHAWLWSDFKENVKSNFKQALLVFIIDIVVLSVFSLAIAVYSKMPGVMGGLKYVVYALLLLYAMMHLYIYPMMVTFDLKISDLYKNALLFAISRMPINIFVILVLVLLHIAIPVWAVLYGGTYYLLLLFLVLMLELVLTQGFSAFLVNFSVYPAIKKYMLDVAEQTDDVTRTQIEDKGEI